MQRVMQRDLSFVMLSVGSRYQRLRVASNMERGLKRKGGGVWQRQLKRVREEPGSSDAAAEASAKSKLARYLILQVLRGQISPNLAQKLASLAKEDLDVAREGGLHFASSTWRCSQTLVQVIRTTD